jgi:S-adenosylmethionine decarboxylase proenzyme
MSISYENALISGRHMICDLKQISNITLLNDVDKLKEIMDFICDKYNYSILQKIEHIFEPQGSTIIYMLSESHMSIHTFPEKNYIAFDLYTCRSYPDNSVYNEIYEYLITEFQSLKEEPILIHRSF